MPLLGYLPNFIVIERKCQDFFLSVAYPELTVQQDETPQPPPPKEGTEGEDDETLLPWQQLNADSFFLMSFEPHSVQTVSFSVVPIFWSTAKVLWHLLHTYS
jgi:hypothetical protein